NGFSKAFAMTGWRMGYVCAPAELINVAVKIHQYTIMCAPTQGQVAAEEALRVGREDGWQDVETMRRSYDQRRRLMVKAFRDMGLDCFEPLGAFYVFPSIRSTGMTSDVFCETLLREKKVACVPGTAFGACGEGHIRCCYATGVDQLNEALSRIESFVRGLPR
ncbi:MAG: aminotransferase class I/II-fold pyridoxal phosphate-dependent enzyme, partial [Eubacteriales bacterium]|nr:aminotransferase class I/II-fold pyridoxal phosphate-dependent enzyme [Eubacteriales bacterium]